MRHYLLLFITTTLLAVCFSFYFYRKTEKKSTTVSKKQSNKREDKKAEWLRLQQHAQQIKSYVLKQHFNNRFVFLIDLKLPSGSNRFFVYDLNNDSVAKAGLVTHGSGTTYQSTIKFSNKPGSNCSSLGKYKIGGSYMGNFGLAFKLHGLDSSNSNAFNRFVVLHSHACVPAEEVYPQTICKSWGCPTVAPTFLNTLKHYINESPQPVMLWIFN